jgi:hypothetical protein
MKKAYKPVTHATEFISSQELLAYICSSQQLEYPCINYDITYYIKKGWIKNGISNYSTYYSIDKYK